jgi:hypothetical protein
MKITALMESAVICSSLIALTVGFCYRQCNDTASIHSGELVRAYPCKEDPAYHFPSHRRDTISNVERIECMEGVEVGYISSRRPPPLLSPSRNSVCLVSRVCTATVLEIRFVYKLGP